MQRIYLPSHVRAVHCDPIVIERSLDGTSYRFPGRTDAPAKEGYVRLELQPAEARRELKKINAIERQKISERVEDDHRWLDAVESKNRPDLRTAMESMSPQWRAFAQRAIEYNNSRRPKTEDPNVTCEVLEMDASNRVAWLDRDRHGRSRK